MTTVAGARALLEEAALAAPIGGIFNLAAVWRDALLENQTAENFETVTKPKINGQLLGNKKSCSGLSV